MLYENQDYILNIKIIIKFIKQSIKRFEKPLKTI